MITYFKDRKAYDIEEYNKFFIKRSGLANKSEYLDKFEKEINYSFQKNHRNFILEYENSYLDSDKYHIELNDEIPSYGKSIQYIDILALNDENYGFSNSVKMLKDHIPSSMLPIACVDLSNFILFHKRFGEIFLYVHDEYANDSGYPVFKIFDCLKELLDSIVLLDD